MCSYLRGTYFPSINFPEQAAEEYLNALQKLDNKNFKKFFQVCIEFPSQSSKTRNGVG